MMEPAYVWITMLGWTVLSSVIALVARKGLGIGSAEYFIGGRRLRGFVSGMTYAATTYSAFMLVGLVGLTYRSGVGALGFEMTYLVFTVLFLMVFGPRFWLVGNRYEHITPPELIANRFKNKGVAVTSASISFVMLIPYAAVQLIGAGLLVEGLTGGRIPFYAGVLVMAALSGFGAFWAGMRSVAWTDAFQGVTMIITSLIALVFVIFDFFEGPAGFVQTIEANHPELLEFSWSPNLFIGLTLPWAFFALTNPQVAQRMYIPDKARSLKRMILFFAIFGFLYTLISTVFGFQAAAIMPGLENPDNAMPSLLGRLPTVLGLIIFVGIFSAATSTLGSIILTLSSLFTRDIAKVAKPTLTQKSETWLGRVAVIVILVACIVFAFFRPGLITVISSMASGGLLVMAPTIIATFFWKRATAAGALSSMIAGAVVVAVITIGGPALRLFGWWPAVWGLIVTTAVFVIVSLATKPPAGAGAFIDQVETDLSAKGFRLVGRAAGRSRSSATGGAAAAKATGSPLAGAPPSGRAPGADTKGQE